MLPRGEPDLVSKLREALQAARRFVRGRHSTLTYGPQALLEQIDAAIALLGREGQAAESPADPLFTELQIRRWLHYFKDDYAAIASAINAVVKQAYKAVQPSPSTPIVPGTPDDPRFNGIVVEVAEEFAILDEDIPALRQILARLQPALVLSAEQVALAVAANKLLPDPPGGYDMEGIAKDLNAVLGAVKPAGDGPSTVREALYEARIYKLEQRIAQIRKSVLEEAALIIDKEIADRENIDDHMLPLRSLASLIRALAERPAPAGEVRISRWQCPHCAHVNSMISSHCENCKIPLVNTAR